MPGLRKLVGTLAVWMTAAAVMASAATAIPVVPDGGFETPVVMGIQQFDAANSDEAACAPDPWSEEDPIDRAHAGHVVDH